MGAEAAAAAGQEGRPEAGRGPVSEGEGTEFGRQVHVPCRAVLPWPAFLSVCEPSTCAVPMLGPTSSRDVPLHTGSPLLSSLSPVSFPFSGPWDSTSPRPLPDLSPSPPRPPPSSLGGPRVAHRSSSLLRWKRSGRPRPEVRPLLPLGLLSPAPVRRWLPQARRRGPGLAQGRVSACGTSPRCAALSGWAS